MEAVRERWTDDRMDDLVARVDNGFTQVDQRFEQIHQDIRELRQENKQFATEMRIEIASLQSATNRRFDRLIYTLLAAMLSGLVALIGTSAF